MGEIQLAIENVQKNARMSNIKDSFKDTANKMKTIQWFPTSDTRFSSGTSAAIKGKSVPVSEDVNNLLCWNTFVSK